MISPHWFGQPGEELFGLLHAPDTADGRAPRRGVLLVGPLGLEALTTYRGLRYTAEQLSANPRFGDPLVLRYDHWGLGNSTGDSLAPDAWTRWVDGVRTGVAHLRDQGAETVSVIGVRAGALIAHAAMCAGGGAPDACAPAVDQVVFWDPPLSGKRWLRSVVAAQTLAVGSVPGDAGVSAPGLHISHSAAAALQAATWAGTGADSGVGTDSASEAGTGSSGAASTGVGTGSDSGVPATGAASGSAASGTSSPDGACSNAAAPGPRILLAARPGTLNSRALAPLRAAAERSGGACVELRDAEAFVTPELFVHHVPTRDTRAILDAMASAPARNGEVGAREGAGAQGSTARTEADAAIGAPERAAEAGARGEDAAAGARTACATAPAPALRTQISVGRTADGCEIVERVEYVTEHHLMRLTTAAAGETPVATVLFESTANEPAWGPNDAWVAAARAHAGAGVQCVRHDKTGGGEAGSVGPDSIAVLYSHESRRDAAAVALTTGTDPKNLLLVGMCSGAWMAAETALRIGAGAVLMFSVLQWSRVREPVTREFLEDYGYDLRSGRMRAEVAEPTTAGSEDGGRGSEVSRRGATGGATGGEAGGEARAHGNVPGQAQGTPQVQAREQTQGRNQAGAQGEELGRNQGRKLVRNLGRDQGSAHSPEPLRARLKERLRRLLPLPAWEELGRRGVTQVPGPLLRELHAAGVRTTVALTPEDVRHFVYHRGDDCLVRLRKQGWTGRVLTLDTPRGDHNLYRSDTRAQALALISDEVAQLRQRAGLAAPAKPAPDTPAAPTAPATPSTPKAPEAAPHPVPDVPRVLFANENIGGHRTVHAALRRVFAGRTDVHAEFLDGLEPGLLGKLLRAPIPGLAGMDADLQPLRGQLVHSFFLRRKVARRLARGDIDALHIYTQNGVLGRQLWQPIPTVITTDSTGRLNVFSIPYREPTALTPLASRINPLFERPVLRRAHRIFANTEHVVDSLTGPDYGIPAERVQHLRMGIWSPYLQETGAPPANARGEDAPGTRKPVIVFVGTTLARKGGDVLLELWRERFRDRADLLLITCEAVPGADAEPGLTLVRDLTPGDPRLWELLAGADIMCFPSVIDQAPNAVLEASSAGLPVIAHPGGAIPEMVIDGVTGILADGYNPDAVADALDRLISDPPLRRRMGAAGAEHIRQNYSMYRSANVLVAALRDAIAAGVPTATPRKGQS